MKLWSNESRSNLIWSEADVSYLCIALMKYPDIANYFGTYSIIKLKSNLEDIFWNKSILNKQYSRSLKVAKEISKSTLIISSYFLRYLDLIKA